MGFVYMFLVSTAEGVPLAYKVGSTKQSLEERMYQLNNEFNHSYYWELVTAKESRDYIADEDIIKEVFREKFGKQVWKKWGWSEECYELSAGPLLLHCISHL